MSKNLLFGVITMIGIAMYAFLQMNKDKELLKEPNDSAVFDSFHHWKQRHGKVYGDEENDSKFQVYKQNYMFVHQHNMNNQEESSLKLELNQFADFTNQQFKQIFHGYKHQEPKNPQSLNDSEIPKELDWRKKGAVTNVKNQGQCGSCWAFSTTGALEGMHFIKTGNLVEFSEQQLVDCSGDVGNQGCNGGLMDNAFKYVEEQGITTEKSYPYKAFMGQCNIPKNSDLVKIQGYVDVPRNSNKQLLLALNKGPVSVAIDAESSYFQLYKSGVYQQECGTNLDHGVLLVGYGEDNGVKYFIIKNSWGPQWGENGYIRILRNENDDAGQCGIRLSASYPKETKDYVTQ